jgi:hypothetical protein
LTREISLTSQPQPTPGEGRTAGQYLRPLRDLAAYVLVGATAVLLFVAIVRLIPGSTPGYSLRTQDAFYGFVNTQTVFFPLGAVLLALLVQPRHPKAQLIVLGALVEYAVAAFFGVFFGLLIGVINHASNNGVRTAFEEFLVRVAWLAVLAVAAYAVFLIWRGMFYVAKPKPQPGVYGTPPQYNPAAYPGQPGFGPQPGQPGFPPPGHPGFQAPTTAFPAPQSAPPAGYPAPQSAPPAGYPAPQSAPPAGSAPPAYGPGVYGQPTPPQPQQPPSWNQPPVAMPAAPPPPSTDPTQVVPPSEPDRTAKLPDDRPGFGPADQDPPRQ